MAREKGQMERGQYPVPVNEKGHIECVGSIE